MFADCIDKMSRAACGGCEREDACSRIFSSLFGAPRREPRQPARQNPFLAFLGEVARAIETKAAPREGSFAFAVERQLEPMLARGAIRIDAVARALGCSRQTLYRRLKAEGRTFEQLLDDLRRRLALSLVRDQGVTVKEAAWRLGFSEPAAFSRAFKRWTGKAPRAMRPGAQSG